MINVSKAKNMYMFETYYINNIDESRYFFLLLLIVSTILKLNNEGNPRLNLPRQSEPHQYNLVATLHSYTYNTSSNLPLFLHTTHNNNRWKFM